MWSLHRIASTIAAAAALIAPGGPACGAAAPEHVADGVYLLRGGFDPARQPDGNSVVFAGRNGLVVVDTGRHAAHTQTLLDFAAARGQPIAIVVNSHWHLDHLGGNALLRQQMPGLKILASDAVAPALSGWLADSRRDMQAMLDSGRADAATREMIAIDIALIDAGARLLPDAALSGARTEIDGAGRPLLVGLARDAVTGGDLWVYDAASRVVAAGDLVTLPVPFLDTACAPRWRATLGELDTAVPFDMLIPGHGAPMSRTDFAADPARTAASCADGWIAGLGGLLAPGEHARTRSMLDYYLGEHLRAPPTQRDRFCPAPAGKGAS